MNASLLMALLTVQPPAADATEPAYEDLVVTAPRRTLAPLPEPIEQFRRHCFDATRRDQRAALPSDASEWAPLEDYEREALRLDPAVAAVALADPARGHRLVLTVEERALPGRLTESRCSLIVIGGGNHAGLAGGMAQLFGGAGTSRHLGHAAGTPRIPGWSHLIWTAMPQRGSRMWRVSQERGQAGSFLVVTDPEFYNSYDFVLGDLKQSESRATNVAILSLVLIRKGRR